MKIKHAGAGAAVAAAAAVLMAGASVAPATAAPRAASGHTEAAPRNVYTEATPAASAAQPPVQNVINHLYGTCMDDSSGAHLRMYACSTDSFLNGYQAWKITDDGGSFKLMNEKTQLCLDGSAGSAGLRTYTCSAASYNNGYQKWVIYWENADRTWVDWKNVATGKCLDYSQGGGLRLNTCSSASFTNGYQEWTYNS
ncbi:RICIN domain-containing protein [Streptomyces sp. V4-01]|uniref:RICIN domain-containing protein n=1 Tax=Actinacidiphila polyblastidii TaxID=3110430 RepID=A0ABU7P3L8_9ACTN|nr:RICIN domain-containing protein [Streptomyces sp. V4-01]